MMYRGCERSVITYSSLISACEKAGQVRWGRWVRWGRGGCAVMGGRAVVRRAGRQVPASGKVTANASSDGCTLSRPSLFDLAHSPPSLPSPGPPPLAPLQWELALELFQEMVREQCTPNTVTYNSLITALAQGAQWQKAGEVFEQMQGQGCHPDVVTYTALISAFEKGGQWRLALEVRHPLCTAAVCVRLCRLPLFLLRPFAAGQHSVWCGMACSGLAGAARCCRPLPSTHSSPPALLPPACLPACLPPACPCCRPTTA